MKTCVGARMIVEADGSQHADSRRDAVRDAFLAPRRPAGERPSSGRLAPATFSRREKGRLTSQLLCDKYA